MAQRGYSPIAFGYLYYLCAFQMYPVCVMCGVTSYGVCVWSGKELTRRTLSLRGAEPERRWGPMASGPKKGIMSPSLVAWSFLTQFVQMSTAVQPSSDCHLDHGLISRSSSFASWMK